jgi:hypothetical protein
VIAHPSHKRDPAANRERTKSSWVSGGRKHHHQRTFTAFRSAHLKIVIACSPESTVTVAAIIVIPVAPPVRCSIPLLPAPVHPVPPPLYSAVFHAAPTGAGRGIAFGDGLLIGPLPLARALAAMRRSLVLAGGRSRLRPFGIRRLRSNGPPNGLRIRGRIRGAAIGRGELFRRAERAAFETIGIALRTSLLIAWSCAIGQHIFRG